ncbi:wall-associated receptor kinase 5-like isoform X1 [Vitis riparia]|uniref:wall-associated receptor kinase 5-like isoform X1 n=1 Tax=Vitis riparia TaxID=96939 RepID=UPI00155B3811|nr:wall-associated receptor kinase 5-like isoform X1 [Vitis riparia]
MTKPGCPEKCGNITIPYPFGMGKGCYLNRNFEITCNMSSNPPRPLLLQEVQLLQISEDYLRINDIVHHSCFNKQSGKTNSSHVPYNRTHHFSYSHTQNEFIAIGCDIFAYITEGNSKTNATGCASLCNTDKDIATDFSSSACSGIGCCRTYLQTDISRFYLKMRSINMITPIWTSQPCGLAFISERNFFIRQYFNLSSKFLERNLYFVPAVLDWSVGEVSCPEAIRRKNYACGQNTYCNNSIQGQGYKCHCSKGYQGNPYLANGCQDINECNDPDETFCLKIALCTNVPGSYSCTCPTDYHGDGKKDGIGCIRGKHPHLLSLVLSLGIKLYHSPTPSTRIPFSTLTFVPDVGVGITVVPFILIATSLRLYRGLEKREKKKIKQKFFKKNGGLLLQQQISSSKESVEKTKLYSVEELEKATDGFNASRIIGKGGLGTVYKGMLSDGTIVAIKKSNTVDEKQLDQFINEVLILSQINHRHIVKLLGCCLETEVPLLVYEYVSNGPLSHHLHEEGHVYRISWKNRLRIASEIAGALAYLHSHASIAICHRDIKSSNILLDENLRAVLSDFGLSRSIPLDKTHLTALVQGTFGYLDPDYFHSGQLTDKSDVYAFGVVLAELLTGEKAISFDRFEQGLASHFRSAMKQNHLFDILDNQVVNEGQKDDIFAVAKLTKRCLKLNGKKRPTMKQVEIDLQQLGRFQEQFSCQKSMIQEDFSQQQTFQDYCTVSERSHSYTFGPAAEEIVQDIEVLFS